MTRTHAAPPRPFSRRRLRPPIRLRRPPADWQYSSPGCGFFSTKSASDRHWGRIARPGFGAFSSSECSQSAGRRPCLSPSDGDSSSPPATAAVLRLLICLAEHRPLAGPVLAAAPPSRLALADCALLNPSGDCTLGCSTCSPSPTAAP
ncbi:hypothetical protein BS78_08G155700 [Paspalum vaginatum]|nr:hypothetical protein BS78_08G155700 [Paspalum vaginatum]